MNKDMEIIIEIAEKLDWGVRVDKNEWEFSKFSPAGQDFNITITANNLRDIVDKIQERCNNFDCSQETHLWLDNTGHGMNGAPEDMKDLYEDMEACLEMMEELFNELDRLIE